MAIAKQAAFAALDKNIRPQISLYLHEGKVVVLLGVSGSGKSHLAVKCLPSATVISGLNGEYIAHWEVNTDLIGEELYKVNPDEFIRSRNQAIALGHRVIITGMTWSDVLHHLAGLDSDRYRVFDLDKLWALHGYVPVRPKGIPSTLNVLP